MRSTIHENAGSRCETVSPYGRAYLRLFSLLFLNLALLFPTLAAPPAIFIDNPSQGQVLSGIIACYGWAVGETHPIKEVQLIIDGGSSSFAVGYGGDREDVANAFPHIPDANKSGFAVALNTRLLTNGPHSLEVVATNTNEATASKQVHFSVSNAPGDENPHAMVVDVTRAETFAVSPTELMLIGISINDQLLDTVLQFDPSSNHFVMTSFAADFDGDGFPDEAQVEPEVLVGAGDIARCGHPGAEETAQLLDQIEGTVFTAGDNAYEKGKKEEYLSCYEPSWGRHKERTRPSPGNHEYKTSGAQSYFEYFGENAGPAGRGYYSYDVGAWHIVSLNSNISARAGSAQVTWLREDLAAHPRTCTLAYWHHPVFSSGKHGNDGRMREVWRVLHEFGADVVVNGHDHIYERFAPQTPDGALDEASGIREFIVGTGGKSLYRFGKVRGNSQVRDNSTFGILKLTLYETSYDWEFIPVVGKTFSDNGSDECVF